MKVRWARVISVHCKERPPNLSPLPTLSGSRHRTASCRSTNGSLWWRGRSESVAPSTSSCTRCGTRLFGGARACTGYVGAVPSKWSSQIPSDRRRLKSARHHEQCLVDPVMRFARARRGTIESSASRSRDGAFHVRAAAEPASILPAAADLPGNFFGACVCRTPPFAPRRAAVARLPCARACARCLLLGRPSRRAATITMLALRLGNGRYHPVSLHCFPSAASARWLRFWAARDIITECVCVR